MTLLLHSALFSMWKFVTTLSLGNFIILCKFYCHQMFHSLVYGISWTLGRPFRSTSISLIFFSCFQTLVFLLNVLTDFLKYNFQIFYCVLYISNIYFCVQGSFVFIVKSSTCFSFSPIELPQTSTTPGTCPHRPLPVSCALCYAYMHA